MRGLLAMPQIGRKVTWQTRKRVESGSGLCCNWHGAHGCRRPPYDVVRWIIGSLNVLHMRGSDARMDYLKPCEVYHGLRCLSLHYFYTELSDAGIPGIPERPYLMLGPDHSMPVVYST